MGVFKKLKDVLFDVEEDEIPVITKEPKKAPDDESPTKEISRSKITEEIRKKFERSSKPKKEENTITEIKMPKEELSERGPSKPESTFNFPLEVDEPKPPLRFSRSIDLDDEPKPKKNLDDFSRVMREEPRRDESKPFKPTPIISPVYGILDQNYSKDDVIVKTDIGVKGPDLDEVRKKAYGLEEKPVGPKKEPAKKVEPKVPSVVNTETEEDALKTLDEILMEEEKAQAEAEKTKTVVKPVIHKPSEDKSQKLDETLETDLFNLIDSMYEDKEERDELA